MKIPSLWCRHRGKYIENIVWHLKIFCVCRPSVTWQRPTGELITVRKGSNKIKCKYQLTSSWTHLTNIVFQPRRFPARRYSSIRSVRTFLFCLVWTKYFNIYSYNERINVTHILQVTRSEMGAYMCIAKNGVPPAVGKTVQLNVHCKLDSYIYCM